MKIYRPWRESSFPVSALAEEEGIDPGLMVRVYWEICQEAEHGAFRHGNPHQMKLLNLFTDPREFFRIMNNLVEIRSRYRPISL